MNQVEGVETTYLDITDIQAIQKMVSENGVEAIINCVAYTNSTCFTTVDFPI